MVELGFDDGIAGANIVGCVGEVALDEALDDVEQNAVALEMLAMKDELEEAREDKRFVMYAEDRTTKCQSKTVYVALEPMFPGV